MSGYLTDSFLVIPLPNPEQGGRPEQHQAITPQPYPVQTRIVRVLEVEMGHPASHGHEERDEYPENHNRPLPPKPSNGQDDQPRQHGKQAASGVGQRDGRCEHHERDDLGELEPAGLAVAEQVEGDDDPDLEQDT